MADGHYPTDSAFATLYFPEQGSRAWSKAPCRSSASTTRGLKGQGYRNGGHEGLPRFRNCTFKGEYPFGYTSLSDPQIPLTVTITGFNPFIPLDDKNSSLPCAILEYTLANPTGKPVAYEFAYHLAHFAHTSHDYSKTRNAIIPDTGVNMFNLEEEDSPSYGSCALGVVGHEPAIKAMWFRGGWFDSISALWKEVSTGTFSTNDGAKAATSAGRNGASIMLTGTLQPGEKVTYPIIISWYFANVHYAFGEVKKAETEIMSYAEHGGGTENCGPNCDCKKTTPPRWKPYYASQWKDARDVLKYTRDHYAMLRSRTQAFHDALFRSTLPGYVLDAVSANLAIMKSPTVLRQFNGNLWAWEGCSATADVATARAPMCGTMPGLPAPFPALERTFREQELQRSMDERGHINFRSALPDGPTAHSFHPAADGQLGGIMKVYANG